MPPDGLTPYISGYPQQIKHEDWKYALNMKVDSKENQLYMLDFPASHVWLPEDPIKIILLVTSIPIHDHKISTIP